jgi:hypothetical protein
LTGDLEAAERKMGTPKSDAPADSSPAAPKPGASPDAQTEPASGPGEPKPKADRDWRATRQRLAELERENTTYKAKLEVYERERAASRPPAPAAPQETPKPAPKVDGRPEFPDIEAFQSPKEYQKAVKEWQQKDSEWVQRQFDQRLTQSKAQEHQAKSAEAWTSQLNDARKIHTDYDQVVFSDKVPLSYITQGLIQSMPDGALRAYALAKAPEEATRIADLTHIPGEKHFKSYAEFIRWVNSSPQVAMIYGEKLAEAKRELAKLTVGQAPKPTPQPKPLKDVIARAPRPSAEVDVEENAAPVGDPAAQALKNGDFAAYKRLKNEEDRRRMQRK